MKPTKRTPAQHLFRAADRAKVAEEQSTHPWNPKSDLRGHMLADAVGLERVGVNLLRIPPGKESFILHSHAFEEEFVFVISGRAVAQIGEETFEIGPGDFMGFPTPSLAHHLRNPFGEDFVYLSGGERRPFEVARYPNEQRIMVREGAKVTLFEESSALPNPWSGERRNKSDDR